MTRCAAVITRQSSASFQRMSGFRPTRQRLTPGDDPNGGYPEKGRKKPGPSVLGGGRSRLLVATVRYWAMAEWLRR